jgi:thiamine biosynthesis lipoprotein ApbE
MSIRVKNMAVATSGDYNQYYGSYETSHIINSQELISVTTVGSNLMEADVLATALFVATEEKELIRKFKSYSFLTIDHNLKLRYYNGFSKMVVS